MAARGEVVRAVVLCLLTGCAGSEVGAETASTRQALDGGSGFKQLKEDVSFSTMERRRIDDLNALIFDNKPLKPKLCFTPFPTPITAINVDRSLFVHDEATLQAADFSLNRTLSKIAADAVAAGATGTTAVTLFRDFWDTQNTFGTAATPGGAHCDDNGGLLNGFPNPCLPDEGAQAHNPALELTRYKPLALVNRLDLASEKGKNCGEHRIIYGRNDGQRSFIIFEAVLPNPRPGCADACRPVAAKWASLSSMNDPAARAAALEELFYVGIPGFRPVVHLEHYAVGGSSSSYGGSGSGQIRTNVFMTRPWTLKEFKLAVDCTNAPCVVDPVPVPVAVNPNGFLWAESTDTLPAAFHDEVVTQVGTLASTNLNTISYAVPVQFDDARSVAVPVPPDDYEQVYGPGPGAFHTALTTAAATVSLSDLEVVRRANTQSCAGCHEPAGFGLTAPGALGLGMEWPNSLGFVHIEDFVVGGSFPLSPALTNVFLPARRQHLVNLLNDEVCPCVDKRLPVKELAELTTGISGPFKGLDEVAKTQQTIEQRLATKGTPVQELSRTAKGQVFPSVQQAGRDVRRQSQARQQDVWKLLEQEPLRKTVTGHFRSH